MTDTDLFQHLLHCLDAARDAAKDILASHTNCGCAFCREVTGIECALELFAGTLRCRSPAETDEEAEAIGAA